jgi:uncharacterized protein (DUF1330 family)
VDVRFELGVRAVMVALNCRFHERSVHPLNLTVPVKRFAIIGFDSIDKAKGWYASAEMKDINRVYNENTKGRLFAVKAR